MLSRDGTRDPQLGRDTSASSVKTLGKARVVSLDVIRGITIALSKCTLHYI